MTKATKTTANDNGLQRLKEDALQQEVDLLDGDGRERTPDELRKAIEEKREGLRTAPEMPPQSSPSSEGEEGADGRRGPKARSSAASRSAADLRTKIGKPGAALLKACNLGEPTDADYELAEQHGYPIAIPGAKPYRISIEIRDVFGAGDRPAGSVMLLTDSVAANKLEFLTPL